MEMEGSGREEGGSRSLHAFFPSSSLNEIEKEHMFDKTVTPSDVGKLNRLVIPKQHAERFFPLDSSSNEKGLLLNFEDREGKEWRFRYSYWNSSQSYVMTKGWSRFVKEKRLDAGDTVSFSRGVGDAVRDRLFIDWKRRPADVLLDRSHLAIPSPYGPMMSFATARTVVPWGRLFVPSPPPPPPPPPAATSALYGQHHRPTSYPCSLSGSPYLYHTRSTIGAASHNRVLQYGGSSTAGPAGQANYLSTTTTLPEDDHSKGGVRLFGVNLDHPPLQLSLGTAGVSTSDGETTQNSNLPEIAYYGR